MKGRGAKTKPLGTPIETSTSLDQFPLTTTLFLWLVK